MPSASLKSRINAFESLSNGSPPISRYPAKPQHLLESPIPPAAFSYVAIKPFKSPQSFSRSPSSSPPHLGRKTSLIDLKDWVVDDGPFPVRQNGFGTFAKGEWNGPGRFETNKSHPPQLNSSAGILINFDIPSKPLPVKKAPPLPPRKESYNSLKSLSSSHSSQSRKGIPTSPGAFAVQHTYPPSSTLHVKDDPRRAGHASASSISSFHSVSLSSDGGTTDASTSCTVSNFITSVPMDREGGEVDAVSLDDSFEDVSTLSIASPTTAGKLVSNWQYPTPRRHPPRLPQRPPVANTSPPKVLTLPKSQPRPSPPPSRINSQSPSVGAFLVSHAGSDRSSIPSPTSRTPISQKVSLRRPPPIPTSARGRYEKVFVTNILNHRKQTAAAAAKLATPSPKKVRQAAGWRGLSVDLITNSGTNRDGERNGTSKERPDEEVDDVVGPDEKLDGHIVKLIWSASKLDRVKLREIWNECDPSGQGSLNRESFIKGMWRIDEELRRAQGKPSPSTSSSHRNRPPPKVTTAKPILR